MPVYEGTTIEAAIQHGLKLLGVTKEQVTIKILDQGKKGFLGIGKKEAQVSLELKEVEQQTTEISQTIVEEEKPANEVSPVTRTQTLESLDNEEALKQLAIYLVEITNQMDAPATVTMSHEDHLIVFQLDTEKQGLLIGKHGKMLNAIQYLAELDVPISPIVPVNFSSPLIMYFDPSASQLSSINHKLCLSQNFLTTPKSNGFPRVCAAITTFVFSDNAFSNIVTSILYCGIVTSMNTGTTPY